MIHLETLAAFIQIQHSAALRQIAGEPFHDEACELEGRASALEDLAQSISMGLEDAEAALFLGLCGLGVMA